MGKLFDLDSPIMRLLSKVADLMIVNFLTLLCCIPIVTIGAAMSAAHYVLLKLKRDEEGYITKDFFRAFKENFKQATIMWLIFLLIFAVLIGDYLIITYNTVVEIPFFVQAIILVIGILAVFTMTWVFAVQAKFVNTVKNTMKNALMLSILNLFRTILMIIVSVIPGLIFALSVQLMPVAFLFGISGPIYISVMLYNKPFKKLEDRILEGQAGEEGDEAQGETEPKEDERIFHDEPMELSINPTEEPGKGGKM